MESTKIEACCDDTILPTVSFNSKPNSNAFIIGLAHLALTVAVIESGYLLPRRVESTIMTPLLVAATRASSKFILLKLNDQLDSCPSVLLK